MSMTKLATLGTCVAAFALAGWAPAEVAPPSEPEDVPVEVAPVCPAHVAIAATGPLFTMERAALLPQADAIAIVMSASHGIANLASLAHANAIAPFVRDYAAGILAQHRGIQAGLGAFAPQGAIAPTGAFAPTGALAGVGAVPAACPVLGDIGLATRELEGQVGPQFDETYLEMQTSLNARLLEAVDTILAATQLTEAAARELAAVRDALMQAEGACPAAPVAGY